MNLEEELWRFLPKARVHADPLSLTAAASDASFYQIRPRVVVDALSADEVQGILELCARRRIGVTFRAAGTSLSGQAQGEGIILRVSRGWREIRVLDQGLRVALGPGVIGAHANAALKPHGRRIGPDPASIQSCMIGGIVANNASGMCCGVAQNSYQTLDSLRLILPPREAGPRGKATLLDTGEAASRESFRGSHGELLGELSRLRAEVLADPTLSAEIRRKYRIKNTLGYSINAFVDYEDPIDILAHLMVGSEGTLGFISQVTYRTVEDPANRSCALLFFATLGAACRAAIQLKVADVAAAELMDRASLRSVEGKPGMPDFLRDLPAGAAALLVEVRARRASGLAEQEAAALRALGDEPFLRAPQFSQVPSVYEAWWEIRRGLFPALGRSRPPGTTLIIEDIALPPESLAQGAEELETLLRAHGYREAIVYGHALEGNLHFVMAQDFHSPGEVERYARFMDALAALVVDRWHGSLKAEHGTGRNMAPFVEREWGPRAYSIMQRLKAALDPLGILNPGVILNSDPRVHLDALKTTPLVDPLVDACIECGFCEVQCPSKDLTLTPRQRIAAFRQLRREPAVLGSQGLDGARYLLDETCAADGLCSLSCPVGIDTGGLVKKLRSGELELGAPHGWGRRLWRRGAEALARLAARHWGLVLGAVRLGLRVVALLPGRAGRASAREWMPRAALPVRPTGAGPGPELVYFPSCVSRVLGPSEADPDQRPLPQAMSSVLGKAGFRVRLPSAAEALCCGLPFESKGFPEAAAQSLRRLRESLLEVSENGRIPIVTDTSPCALRMLRGLVPELRVQDSVELLHDLVLGGGGKAPRLKLLPTDQTIALHLTCSSQHLGHASKVVALAQACARRVVVPERVGCCGFAGDKGFVLPELNASALEALKPQVASVCSAGFSTSRTCEAGLSRVSGISYQSIVYLIDRCSEAEGSAVP